MSGSGVRYSEPNVFETDVNGVPIAAARLFFYASGTSSPQDTFSDVGLTVPNPNPVVADANGRFGSIFLVPSPAYKVQLWTPATLDDPVGSQIWSEDPVGPGSGGGAQATAGIIGEVRMFAGPPASIPTGWYLCYGQAVSRVTYSAAFAVLGTTWGAGDLSTTFNLPDLRGRVGVGKDDMGGSPAGHITSGVAGISGVTLGAAGGDQAVQSHLHAINDPGHVHAITDPGHIHTFTPSNDVVTYPGSGGNSNIVSGTQALGGNIQSAVTGITVDSATTGITTATYGAGASQNVQPSAIVNMIIYLGV